MFKICLRPEKVETHLAQLLYLYQVRFRSTINAILSSTSTEGGFAPMALRSISLSSVELDGQWETFAINMNSFTYQ